MPVVTTEFRVAEKYAPMLFRDDEGQRLGPFTRKIVLDTRDPKYAEVGRINREIWDTGDGYFFAGWITRYRYSAKEIREAKRFHMIIRSTFEPAGEECGTTYDDSVACPLCGTGAPQTSDLILDLRRIPKSSGIATTIANEWIVSQELAELMIDSGLTGFELKPVRHKTHYESASVNLRLVPTGKLLFDLAQRAGIAHDSSQFYVWLSRPENRKLFANAQIEWEDRAEKRRIRRGKPLPVSYQLLINSHAARVVPPTHFGIKPFDNDEDGRYQCSLCDLAGLNLLSEVTVQASTLGECDFACTQQFTGSRAGLIRPYRHIIVTPRVRELFKSSRIKGAHFDVCYAT